MFVEAFTKQKMANLGWMETIWSGELCQMDLFCFMYVLEIRRCLALLVRLCGESPGLNLGQATIDMC
jgi:hypothetical protein